MSNIAKNTDIFLVKRTIGEVSAPESEVTIKQGDIYIMSKWKKYEVQVGEKRDPKIEIVLQASIDGKCYAGALLMDDLKAIATELDMSYNFLLGECHLALSADEKSDSVSLFKFVLATKPQGSFFTLWKQQAEVKMQYFEVKLCEQQSNADMLDALVALVQKMPEAMVTPAAASGLSFPSKSIAQDDICKAMKQCMEAHKKQEKDLLSKFCLVLNTKKQRISDLEILLKSADAQKKIWKMANAPSTSKKARRSTSTETSVSSTSTEASVSSTAAKGKATEASLTAGMDKPIEAPSTPGMGKSIEAMDQDGAETDDDSVFSADTQKMDLNN